jgi:hypothetical protein
MLPAIPAPPLMPGTDAREGAAAGYPPTSPDLGRIQEAMRAALSPIPPQVMRNAWRREGVQWGWDFLKAWVRGMRRADLEFHSGRIDVRFVTGAEHGVYEYAFTVRLAGRSAAMGVNPSPVPGPPSASVT